MAEEKLKLGEILVKSGAISLLDLETFLQEQEELKDERGYQTRLGTLLLEHKLVNEETLALAFAEQQAIDYQDLSNYRPDLNILEKIPFSIIKTFQFVPIFLDSERLVIAIHDPIDSFLFDLLYKALGVHIEICSSARSLIDKCQRDCVQAITDSGRINQDFDVDFEEYRMILEQESEHAEPEIPEVSSIRTLNHRSLEEILKESFGDFGAVALKIRPHLGSIGLFVKLQKWELLGCCDEEHLEKLMVRVKSFCQDSEFQPDGFGQYFIEVRFGEDENQSFSVVSVPVQGMCELVFEPFPSSPQSWSILQSGLLSQELEYFSTMELNARGGWIIGPPSSGKSTFLHSLVWSQSEKGLNPISFESKPSEISHKVWPRTHLDDERNQLQSLGSLRGSATNLVGIDELHPDELGVYLRLLEGRAILATSQGGGIFPTLANLERQGIGLGFHLESLQFIISLKLVPGICPYCSRPHQPTAEELTRLGLKPESLKKPYFVSNDGCDFCENRGFSESTLIYELLKVTPQVVKILQENPLGNEIAMHLVKMGTLVPMNSIAREKLYRGRITLNTYAQVLQKKI